MDIKKVGNCENCRFYLQHYIRATWGYAPTLGHCTCDNLRSVYGRKVFRMQKDCKYWQSNEERDAEFKEKLTEKLKSLARRLEAVCEILTDGKN